MESLEPGKLYYVFHLETSRFQEIFSVVLYFFDGTLINVVCDIPLNEPIMYLESDLITFKDGDSWPVYKVLYKDQVGWLYNDDQIEFKRAFYTDD